MKTDPQPEPPKAPEMVRIPHQKKRSSGFVLAPRPNFVTPATATHLATNDQRARGRRF